MVPCGYAYRAHSRRNRKCDDYYNKYGNRRYGNQDLQSKRRPLYRETVPHQCGGRVRPLYIDNLDIYEGTPDRTRLTTTTVIPGTQTGLRPDSDYFVDLEDEAAGIAIKKNLDSADDNALVMSALYDNSTGKPSLMAAKTKQVTLRTGETVSLTAEEIVHKPAEGDYSVRYFIWRLGETGKTLDVLAAIDGE